MQTRRSSRDMWTTILRLLVIVSLTVFGSAEPRPASAAAGELAAPLDNAWQRVAQVSQAVRSLAASPIDANNIYAAVDQPTTGGVYRSDDGGRTWESNPLLANTGLSNRQVQAVAVCPSGQVFAGTWGGGVYRADAASWTPVIGGIGELYITDLDCDTQGRLFAGTFSKGVFRSTNAGAFLECCQLRADQSEHPLDSLQGHSDLCRHGERRVQFGERRGWLEPDRSAGPSDLGLRV